MPTRRDILAYVPFRYTRPPLTQHLLVGSILLAAVLVGSTHWGAEQWAKLVEGRSPRLLLVGGLMALHTAVYWSVGLFFHQVDLTDRPAYVARYRIQSVRRKHPSFEQTVRVLARNQFIFLPVLLMAMGEVLVMRGWEVETQLPTLGRFVLELIGQTACALVIFYVSHRTLHRKFWMKRVHWVHHQFRTTTALASEYAHPIEFAVGNFFTLAGGALLIGPHLATMYVFALVSVLTILVHHSGYALPWAPYSLPHDWHHYRVKELFGTTGLIDRWLGTDQEFRTLEHDQEVR